MSERTPEEMTKTIETEIKERLSKVANYNDLITKNNEITRREMARILDKQLIEYIEIKGEIK